MIKLELELNALDYEALAEKLLPLVGDRMEGQTLGRLIGSGASSAVAKAALGMMPQEKKDRTAAKLINDHADQLSAAIENAAGKNGVRCRVRALRAKTEE